MESKSESQSLENQTIPTKQVNILQSTRDHQNSILDDTAPPGQAVLVRTSIREALKKKKSKCKLFPKVGVGSTPKFTFFYLIFDKARNYDFKSW